MEKEKVERVKSIQRKRALSMGWYELKRRIGALFPTFKKSSSEGKFRRKQVIFVWRVLAIPLLNWLIFYVYANLDAITMAFRNIDMSTGLEYWTFSNFGKIFKLFKEGNMLLYGKNTLMFWLLGTLWGIPHSILMTYAFHKKLKGYKVFRVILYLPGIICGVAMAGIFQSFISSNGAVGYVLMNLFHVERVPMWFAESEFATYSLLFYNFFFGFAGSLVLYSGAMANIDTEITEAAYMDGVSMWQEICYIDIPLMWPTLSMTVIGTFGGLFGASGPILLFTANLESTWTFGYWIFDQVRRFQSYYLPATLGLCFTLLAFPLAMWIKKWTDRVFTTE